ncbi:MYOSIN-BINDING PROTEIN 2 [Salix koriyanagi]|uniref:MYOSIN-BINDING PROTEIN 2 n=1 Tax=Salix koriyanagi TaxID=2511006 RepID=A0A9Q0VPS5_9ROSI|nr:MYOSIN-BINDING PROTEIN 2 [Salix koriyanagi]
MAGNKFATMLQRNTHKLTVILVYAVLEWILIFLLLLNSLFTYLITKFAKYFGLKNPCPWCSRIDHMLEPGKNTNSCRDLVCERHAAEISKLGYCSNHQKLAETQNMCMDCLASRPNHSDQSAGMTRRIAFFTWVSKDAIENGENIVRCSCCNESINSNVYPPYLLFKPSWDSLKYSKKGDLIVGEMDDEKNGIYCKEISKPGILAHYADHEDNNEIERDDGEGQQDREEAADEQQMLSDAGSFGLKDAVESSRSETNFQCDEKEAYIMERESYGMNSIYQGFDDSMIEYCFGKDNSIEIINLHSERNLGCDFNRLIPVELIDSSTTANYESWSLKEDLAEGIHQNGTTDSASHIEMNNEEQTSHAEVESVDIAMDCCEKSLVSNCTEMKEDSDSMERKQVMSLEEAQTLFLAGNNVDMVETKEPDEFPAHEEENNESNLLAEQTKSKDFVELSDFAVNQPQAQESTISPCPQEDHSSVNGNEATLDAPERNGFGPNSRETTTMEEKLVSADNNQEGINHDLSSHLESTETEEEKFPETPTSVESAHYLHKKLLLFEKRESGNEESLDGSVIKLEEERSASAIAANQTMAMINRLQEEKAAMQMEALQYQRMMEEQSEYDQEALQLLNELMIKREREKQDLEKELEVYRKKVLDYEAKEKLRMMRRIKNGSTRSTTSSATCSNAEDLDELSIDLNREAKDEDGSSSIENQEGGSNNTSSDGVINLQEIALDYVKQISALDDPLAEFEEERLSILDQLKALEEKLQNLDANEDMHSEEQSSKYNARGFDESFEMSTPEENGILNELSKIGDYPERKTVSSMAKNLLPLLDAAENETEEGFVFNENVESEFVGMENSLAPKFDLDGKKLAIEEEVDHVYERLQALEVDREFLNHCMSSMQMGDKGTSLLQEILKHLRDLRGVELRVGNTSEEPLE